MSLNVQDIQWSHKVYRENQGKMKGGIDSREKSLTEVKIHRGIFQGDAQEETLNLANRGL